jgi:hypothetical protein
MQAKASEHTSHGLILHQTLLNHHQSGRVAMDAALIESKIYQKVTQKHAKTHQMPYCQTRSKLKWTNSTTGPKL